LKKVNVLETDLFIYHCIEKNPKRYRMSKIIVVLFNNTCHSSTLYYSTVSSTGTGGLVELEEIPVDRKCNWTWTV